MRWTPGSDDTRAYSGGAPARYCSVAHLSEYQHGVARERRHKLADVSSESLDGWQAFAKKHHVNAAALAEAFGLDLARQVDAPKSKLSPRLIAAIDEAIEIQARRSQRGRRST